MYYVMHCRVPLEKSTTLPLLLLKDYVPLRSKMAVISEKNVRPLPERRSKVFGVKEKKL